MRGKIRRHDHDPAAVALGVALLVATAVPAAAQTPLRLPTEADAVAIASGSQTILYGPEGIERVLPGPVAAREQVLVELSPGGGIGRVSVDQQLTVTGLGDFRFRIPGPARDVVPLPASEGEPGLRRGSMIWQGFSPGERRLAARAELHPEQEAARLPVRVAELSITVDGRPLLPGERATGTMEIRLRLENQTAIPVQIAGARTDRRTTRIALEQVTDLIEAGERPRPGQGGLPRALNARGDVGSRTRPVHAWFELTGSIRLPNLEPEMVQADPPAAVTSTPDGVGLRTRLGPDGLRLRLRAAVEDAPPPSIDLTLVPAVPSLDGRSLPADPLDRLLLLLWEVARLRQYDAYLGNPDPTGPAETSYRYVLAAVRDGAEQPPARRALPSTFGPLGLAVALLALALLLLSGILLWRHS
ncbi:MAG TPA: hypothetical protein VM638_05505 [Actinomycetota bacterium]|nr:hypothetical protein [Actinomycetota bacterium]